LWLNFCRKGEFLPEKILNMGSGLFFSETFSVAPGDTGFCEISSRLILTGMPDFAEDRIVIPARFFPGNEV